MCPVHVAFCWQCRSLELQESERWTLLDPREINLLGGPEKSMVIMLDEIVSLGLRAGQKQSDQHQNSKQATDPGGLQSQDLLCRHMRLLLQA
jgi:hypothetical protein